LLNLSAKQALQYYKLVLNVLSMKNSMHDVVCDVDYCTIYNCDLNGKGKCKW